jgi:Tol biopolymer transport system component
LATKAFLLALLLLGIVACSGSSRADPVEGTWLFSNPGPIAVLSFDEDGNVTEWRAGPSFSSGSGFISGETFRVSLQGIQGTDGEFSMTFEGRSIDLTQLDDPLASSFEAAYLGQFTRSDQAQVISQVLAVKLRSEEVVTPATSSTGGGPILSPPPPSGSKIAFVSYRDGDYEIYVMNGDGTEQTRLTMSEGLDHMPAWSPDGQRLAYTSTRAGEPEQIYVVNVDGTGQRRLTNGRQREDTNPLWSPDGEKIAFVGTDLEKAAEHSLLANSLYVVNQDGSGEIRLSNRPLNSTRDVAWSPDGQQLVLASGGLYLLNVDGSGETQIAESGSGPLWSSDGNRIAFGCRPNICSISPDGSNQVILATAPADTVYIPGWWSPDGRLLGFDAYEPDEEAGAYQYQFVIRAYEMQSDGTGITRVPDVDLDQLIMLNGSYVKRVPSLQEDTVEVYINSEDGSLSFAASRMEPDGTSWSPDGDWIADWQNAVRGRGGFILIRRADEPGPTIVVPDGIDPVWSPVVSE